ncbi:MAG: M48 family metalloprotease [Sedimentisphaerales bacterium]|nr:M48 family metalloprotease [Sedimentisphaerales bacterium]
MEAVLNRISDYLQAQSGQIAVLVMVVAVISWALRHRSAHVRYLLWLVVLAKCLVPPVVHVPLPVLSQAVPEVEAAAVSEVPRWETPALPARVESQPMATTPTTPLAVPPRQLDTQQWLAVVWLTGIAVFALVAATKAGRTVLWLRRQRQPMPPDLQASTVSLLSSLKLKRLPKMWLIEGVGQPFVWGLLRGDVYLPLNFAAVTNDEHRRGILGHELCHVLHLDAAVNILQIVAQMIFWFHPLVWWANRKIRQEREKCCDEMAIARLGAQPREYSTAIINTLVGEQESLRSVPSLAIAGPAKNIEERIRTMLRPGRRFYRRPSAAVAAVTTVFGLLAIPTVLVLTARARASGETDNAVAEGTPEYYPLPPTWRLDYDDGLRAGGARTWKGQMANDLASLEIWPRPTDLQDTSWKDEDYRFEVLSLDGRSVGTIDIRRDDKDGQVPRSKIFRPGKYSLRYRRGGGKSADNFRMYAGPFEIDLSQPGMYKLYFAPKLGNAEITGSVGGCYALNFERTDEGFSVTGFVYQYPAKQYTINGLPAGTYRLSGVTQYDGPNVFVSQAHASVKADEKLTVDINAPPQGDCSLRGVIIGRCGTYWAPTPAPLQTERQWFVLIRTRGSGPVEKTGAYEAQTMDSHYVIRKPRIVQETDTRASYTISGIAPGEYTVTIIEHPRFEGVPIERQQSKLLTLRPGETAALDFDLGDPVVWRYDPNGVRPTGINSELPPLGQIGHAAQADRTKGKRLLVCFFDMNQRPARNCLLELNRRAESLAAQGIAVLAVQASAVQADTLDDWLKQNAIAFPVGQIAGSEDGTRFAWGIEALPWLILTDEHRVVVAQSGALEAIANHCGGMPEDR